MMREKQKTSGFARLYLWTTKAKYTMGIFFVAYVFFYMFLGLLEGGEPLTLDFSTAVQMVFACFFIGLVQQAVLPVEKLNQSRSLIWVFSGAGITLLFSLAFRWFEGLPIGCLIVFMVCIMLGMAAMILAYYFELQWETKRLNRGLEQFQKQNTRKEE